MTKDTARARMITMIETRIESAEEILKHTISDLDLNAKPVTTNLGACLNHCCIEACKALELLDSVLLRLRALK